MMTHKFADETVAASRSIAIGLKKSKVSNGSLRLLGRASWEEGLRTAGFLIKDVVDSSPMEMPMPMASTNKKSSRQTVPRRGSTAYLLNDASLSVSDTEVRMQWTSATVVSDVLTSLMAVVLPTWMKMCPDEYLKHIVYSQTALTNEQSQAEASWAKELKALQEHFVGDHVVLGSERKVAHRLFVVNYSKKEEMVDFFSTQIVASELECKAGFQLPASAVSMSAGPLRKHWAALHGKEPRCPSSKAQFMESYSDAYACNAVFGAHTTSCVSTAVGCDINKVTLSTSMPLTVVARERFISGAQSLSSAKAMCVAEFSLSPMLFNASQAPQLKGFKLVQSSRHLSSNFACTLHHFVQANPALVPESQPEEPSQTTKVITVTDEADAAVAGAELHLSSAESASSDLPVALLDLGALKRQADLWARELPRVAPHYAVKCNSSFDIVSALWSYWDERARAGFPGQHGGFDCASPAEMDVVMHLPGLDTANNIIYANPCKHGSAVEYAKQVGVRRIVFDNAQELEKMKQLYPEAELVLRVETDDSLAQCPLSNKFGAAVADCGVLLERAMELELKVVGVSFHVGSGCSEVGAFRSALHRARAVFDEAEKRGLSLKLLDIGGGFPGLDEPGEATFSEHAADIREMLASHFPDPSIRVIAEPGRFFAAKSQAVLATVLSAADSPQGFRYYLNDGVYGSFNCLVYDHAHVSVPEIFRNGRRAGEAELGSKSRCTIFGPTCDGFDLVSDKLELPHLCCGDKLLFRNMGAYTSSASTSFNGFAPATCVTFESKVQ